MPTTPPPLRSRHSALSPQTARALAPISLGALLVVAGCSSPLAERSETDLRASVIQALRQELREAEKTPERITTQRESYAQQLPIEQRFIDEGLVMAGPQSYTPEEAQIERNLLGRSQEIVRISLEHAIRTSVDKNLSIQFARLQPAIAESQVVQAESAFDWVFTQNVTWSSTDRITQSSGTAQFAPPDPILRQTNSVGSTSGLRRQLTSGGQLSLQQELIYSDSSSPGQQFNPNPATSLGLTATFDQPLLRNFGSDVSLAQVRINRNLEREAIVRLQLELNQLVNNVESAYWDVYQSQQNLMILRRLLERGIEIARQLEVRKTQGLDVDQAQLSDAVARVQARRSNVVTAEISLRRNSDRLKQLINDPSLPVGSEVLLLPLDVPVDIPVTFSLFESIATAVAERPEVQQAILSIDNASIQQIVANNQRLPQLDLRTQLGLSGLDDDLSVYNDTLQGRFIDYLVGVAFEQPIGNRGAEAFARQRRLERTQAVISYRNTIQNVVREVKDALDSMNLNYTLVDQTAAARISAAESLRSLEVQLEIIQGRTALQLEQLLNRQERVANAEQLEIQAITEFNRSVSELHRAMGVILKRNRVELVVPDPIDEIQPWYGTRTLPATNNAVATE